MPFDWNQMGQGMSPQFAPQLPWQRPQQTPMPWQNAQPLGAQGGGMAIPQGRPFGGSGSRLAGFKDQQAQPQQGGMFNPNGSPNGNYFFGQAGQAGVFDPFGSPQLLDMLRQSGLSDMGARLNSNRLNVQLHGNDPYLQAYGSLMGNMGGQSDVFRSLQQAQLQQALQQQQFWQSIFGQGYGGAIQENLQKMQNDSAAKERKQSGRNALIGAGGQLVGAGIGAI
jgi:hypothetical protein